MVFRLFTMPVSSATTFRPPSDSLETFWQECRRRSAELNVPAWQLAEDTYTHENKLPKES
jgi:hypothetical protein